MAEKLPDRRIQRTRKLVQDALIELILEKGYAAVTVQEIIDRANIGRSTFYAHFQDTESLFLSTFDWLWADFERYFAQRANASPQPPWALTLRLFQHVQSQRRLYQAIIGEKAGVAAIAQVHKTLTLRIGNHLRDFAPTAPAPLISLVAHHCIHTIVGLLTWWLDNHLPFSAEEMNETCRTLLQPGVEKVLHPQWPHTQPDRV